MVFGVLLIKSLFCPHIVGRRGSPVVYSRLGKWVKEVELSGRGEQ